MSDKQHSDTARYENSRVSESNGVNKATAGQKAAAVKAADKSVSKVADKVADKLAEKAAEKNVQNVVPNERPTEFGGQKGPEPTRYGDWEKNGRCTDF